MSQLWHSERWKGWVGGVGVGWVWRIIHFSDPDPHLVINMLNGLRVGPVHDLHILLRQWSSHVVWRGIILDIHKVSFKNTIPPRTAYYHGEAWCSVGSWGLHPAPPVHSSPLRWRHNGRDGVSNHQPHQCLVNRLFGRRSKKTSKLRVTGLCVGNSPGTGEFPHKGQWPVNSSHKWPVTRKMFPFHDVIMHHGGWHPVPWWLSGHGYRPWVGCTHLSFSPLACGAHEHGHNRETACSETHQWRHNASRAWGPTFWAFNQHTAAASVIQSQSGTPLASSQNHVDNAPN